MMYMKLPMLLKKYFTIVLQFMPLFLKKKAFMTGVVKAFKRKRKAEVYMVVWLQLMS